MLKEKGGSKRGASIERPEMSGDEGNKIRKTGSTEEFVMLFKVKGTNQGDAGFRAVNPLKVTSALENQRGKEFQAKLLFNGMWRVCCKTGNSIMMLEVWKAGGQDGGIDP